MHPDQPGRGDGHYDQRSAPWRLAFTGTLVITMGMGAFAILSVAALSPAIVADLGLSRTQLGSLATVAFGIAAATSLLGGRQVDVQSGRTVLTWVFLAGGLSVAVMASARSLPWLWLGAVLSGTGLAVANPVTNHLIASHIPAGRQGLHIGLKQSGVPMTQTAVGFALPPLALLIGWRNSLLTGALVAILALLVAVRIVPGGQQRVVGAGRPTAPVSPAVKWLGTYAFTVAMTTTAVLLYTPLFAFERINLTATAAGMTTGVTGAAGVAARIFWGRFAEHRESPADSLSLLAAVAGVAVLIVAASEFVSPWLLWIGLLAFGSSGMAASAVVMFAVIRQSPPGGTGRASGVVGLGMFLGFMSGPVTFGALVDTTNSYLWGWLLIAAICLLALAVVRAWARSAGKVAPDG